MIEEKWKDETIYYVEFITYENKKVNKAIVVDINYSIEEVKKIVMNNFQNIKAVNYVDYWEDCLSLKKK